MAHKEDGLKNFINVLEGDPSMDSTLMFTEKEIQLIRHGNLSYSERTKILQAARKHKLIKEPTHSRPELIAREGQENMTSHQLADLLLAKLKESPKFHIPYTGTKVCINSWSNVGSTFRAWGDYWAWYQLGQAFTDIGYHFNPDPLIADVTIYLRGGKFQTDQMSTVCNRINKETYNIVWVYSHPDAITEDELRDYDEVFCLSHSMAQKCKQMHPKVCEFPLESCSNMKPPKEPNTKFDIVFVGNARGGSINTKGRDVIHWLKPPDGVKVGIWGMKWDLPHLEWVRNKGWWQGHYYPYHRLNQLYSGAKIVINDTHPDMALWGFIPMKILDVLNSGGFVITDYIEGLESKFGPDVPTYKNADELNDLIKFYLNKPDHRAVMSNRAQQNIEHQTFQEAARHITKHSDFPWKRRKSVFERFF